MSFTKLFIIHRDLSPNNILLKEDGQIILIDVGSAQFESEDYLAKLGSGIEKSYREDMNLAQVRNMGYTASEQLKGRPLPQSDFYSIGATMQAICTGENVYDIPKNGKTWYDKAPQITQSVVTLIDDLLEFDPRKRPLNTEFLLKRLDDIDDEIAKKKAELIKFKRKQKIRKRKVVSVFIFAVMVILGSIWGHKITRANAASKYFEQGKEYEYNGELLKAKEQYEKTLKINPNDSESYRRIGEICLTLRDIDCAKKILY